MEIEELEKQKMKKKDMEEAALMASLFKSVSTVRKIGDDNE